VLKLPTKFAIYRKNSSRDIEVEEYEEVVGHPDNSPVLRRSSSAESFNDVSPFQEPMMEVEEEFAPTSRPTLRYSEPELAEQTQVPRKVRLATWLVYVRNVKKIFHQCNICRKRFRPSYFNV